MTLSVRNLTFAYGEHRVLDGVDLDLRPGELCALFGPNGSGKSTLYRCLLGHLRHGGTVTLDGVDLGRLRPAEVARKVSYVPQQHSNPFPFTVLDMVLMGRTPHLGGVFGPRPADVAFCAGVLDQVGLADQRDRLYHTLSGGQRQLVLIARALAQDCGVLLLDEPTASLDFGNQMWVWRTVRELARSGRAVLVCTHEPNHVRWFCDRAVALGRAGRLVADGPPAEVVTTDLVTALYPSVGALAVTADATIAPAEAYRPLPVGVSAGSAGSRQDEPTAE
ncbi:iron complex transport system ATP-binding protein [Micromonospora nigra]|uniref:Iron complex transport system ATP-binding protein n=1 Tax=Micromonospora nigra TaxID=145857 RepID=A0A1C6R8V6_9ACTN|nr:ABC transporter ATP-binding protein [Micromonospora nigra]SCL13532.1 iron complex transport system ATP-binding protein [Micromonospora nigra]